MSTKEIPAASPGIPQVLTLTFRFRQDIHDNICLDETALADESSSGGSMSSGAKEGASVGCGGGMEKMQDASCDRREGEWQRGQAGDFPQQNQVEIE